MPHNAKSKSVLTFMRRLSTTLLSGSDWTLGSQLYKYAPQKTRNSYLCKAKEQATIAKIAKHLMCVYNAKIRGFSLDVRSVVELHKNSPLPLRQQAEEEEPWILNPTAPAAHLFRWKPPMKSTFPSGPKIPQAQRCVVCFQKLKQKFWSWATKIRQSSCLLFSERSATVSKTLFVWYAVV